MHVLASRQLFRDELVNVSLVNFIDGAHHIPDNVLSTRRLRQRPFVHPPFIKVDNFHEIFKIELVNEDLILFVPLKLIKEFIDSNIKLFGETNTGLIDRKEDGNGLLLVRVIHVFEHQLHFKIISLAVDGVF
tara:strand:- start:137 stop:532 length:396 start_codon:yes stop_codon:yes gene_type:complete